jgi:hypothetical protein
MRGVTWKYRQAVNTWEGTVKGDNEPLLFIQGRLCVTDLRESRKSKICISPKTYKIIGLTLKEAKILAEDLVTGDNFEKHEQNRLDWIAEQEKFTKVIQETQEFLDKLKENK